MKWSALSLLLITLSTVSYVTVPVECLFSLEVLVSSYSNLLNTTFDDQCCKENCTACDSIFFFCLRPAGFDRNSDECPWGSYSSAGSPVLDSSKVFSVGNFKQNVGNISNPMEFVGDRWSGSFQLLVRVDHYNDSGDLNDSSVLIDRVFAEKRSFDLGFSFSDLTSLTSNYSNVIMYLKFRAMCQPDYYGAACETYCILNANGRYTCVGGDDETRQPIVVCPTSLVQGVFYEETPSGVSVEKECPQLASASEGVTVVGNTNRTCLLNGTWSEIDTSGCFESRIDFQILSQAATILFDQPNEDIDPQAVQDLIEALLLSTNPLTLQGGSQLMEDLRIATKVLNQSVDYLLFNLEDDDNTPLDFDENVIDAINNVLDENNIEGWNDLQMNDVGTESVLQSAELYGQYVVQAMRSDRIDTGVGSEKEIERTNIILNAATISSDEDYVYPMNVDEEQTFAQSLISSSLLQEKGENYSIVNILFTNLDMFLPDGELLAMTNGTMVGSSIISTQVLTSNNRKVTELNAPAVFRFRTREIQISSNMTIDNVRCVFWDFSSGVDISESTWSVDGISTTFEPNDEDKDNTLIVTCKSNHLTSFAVLFDVHGVLNNITRGERLALEIVTYVGLGISILFLLLTILILLCLDLRKLFREQLLYFIHLNLSLALLLANVTFIAGIDTAVSNRYACVVVAGLLHYLYTAAFFWMLCEGIMLYFKVVLTFSRVSKYLSDKWWFFFLIGWGIPVIPVAVSIGVLHEQYGNDRYCWITVSNHNGGALWAFVVPFVIVIALNTLIFVVALIRIFNSRKAKLEHSDSRAQKMCRLLIYNGLSILPLLGLTWVFGLLAINQATSVFLWLFTVFNSLQGAMIFFFQIVRNPKIWKTLKKKRIPRKSQTQSTSVVKASTHKKSKVTSSSSSTHGIMVSGQHVSYTKSTSVTNFKSSASSKKPNLSFSNPLDVDTLTNEDLSEELFETA